MKSTALPALLLAALSPCHAAINIAFHNGTTTIAGMTSRPDGTVVKTSTDTWNNPYRNGTGGLGLIFSGFALRDHTNTATTATLAATSGYSQFNNNGWGTKSQDFVMMEGWYGFRDAESLTISNLPAEYTSAGYGVIVYGDPIAIRTMDYFIGAKQKTITSPATFYGGTPIEGTNYVIFTGLTASSFTLTGNVASAGRSAVNGLRILTNAELPFNIGSFTASSLFVAPNSSVTLDWEVSGADSLTLDPGAMNVTGLTTTDVIVSADTTYTLTANKSSTSETAMRSLTVRTAPLINFFEASRKTARDTADVRLVWDTLGAQSLTLDPGAIDVTGLTTYTIPGVTTDTTFTLTATFPGGNPTLATTSLDIRSGADPLSLEETIVAHGPLAYYRFEERSPTPFLLLDSSGNARDSLNLSALGLTPNQPGAVGQAWNFNNGSVLLNLNPDPTGDISVALVAKIDVYQGTHSYLSQQDNTGTGRNILQIRGISGNALGTWVGELGFVSSTAIPAIDDWCPVTLVYDHADGELRFYVNGVHLSTTTGAAAISTIGNYVLGANKGRGTEFLRGALDEVAIFDYQLDDPNADGNTADNLIPAQYAAYLRDAAPLLGFSAGATTISQGQSIDLHWKVGDAATTITIDNGVGSVTDSTANGVGTTSVRPATTTTYTITVNGTITRQITVVVNVPLLITSVGFDGSGYFEVTAINLIQGRDYDLFYSGSPDAGYLPVGARITADNTGTATFLDRFADPVNFPTFFYRVQEIAP